MAKNRVFASRSAPLDLPVPEGTKSGDAVMLGNIPGVALTDRRADGKAACDLGGVYKLAVEGKNKGGNKKIEPGDIVFMKGGKLGVNNEEGVRYGYALAVVEAGATTTIEVLVGY